MFTKFFSSFSGRQCYLEWKALQRRVKTEPYVDSFYNRMNVVFRKSLSGKAITGCPLAEKTIEDHDDNNIKKTEEKSARSSQSRLKVADEIHGYLSQTCAADVLNKIPRRYFKRNRVPIDHLALADSRVADVILKCIRRYVVKEGIFILETNPGFGILSKKLIDSGIQQLHLYEPSPVLFKMLKDSFDCHSDKVTFHSTDFLSLWKITYQDKMDNGTRVKDILSYYPTRCWTEDPLVKIVGSIHSSQFIKHLILSLVSQTGIMAHCRPEFYFIMPPSLYLRLTSRGDAGYILYRSISVLFQLFFDYELLEKIPRKTYLPWPMPISKKKRFLEIEHLNEEWLYLMRIVPKRDLYTTVVPPEKLCAMWYFVRHHFWSRSNRLIPDMESWIPGCGVRLILDGYNIYTEFGDLKPEEVLHIFKQFSSWPEYQDSSFLSSMETALLKLDENAEENIGKGGETREDEEETNENINNQNQIQ